MLPLSGFGLGWYRSFGAGPQFVGPLSKINLLAGANNSGKSNVLTFLHEQLSPICDSLRKSQPYSLSEVDRPIDLGEYRFRFALPMSNEKGDIEKLAAQIGAQSSPPEYYSPARDLNALLNAKAFQPAHKVSWLQFDPANNRTGHLAFAQEFVEELSKGTDQVGNGVDSRSWKNMCKALTGQMGSGLQDRAQFVLARLAAASIPNVTVRFIPAFRQMTSEIRDGALPDGDGLVRELQRLERPAHSKRADQAKFEKIVDFVRAVLQVPDAMIQVPHDPTTIHVRLGSRTMPLESLGTGIHQVVLLAAAATLNDGALICLEEPETNLHPTLQRLLIRYLSEKTNNQYVIATHSAHILDTPDSSIFRTKLVDGWTKVELVKSTELHLEVCAELGYCASDLLQANAVIWVEGPSDRVYLLHWIEKVAPELVEGLHFSVMFYGGRLLSGLTTTEKDDTDFIELRRLNQNIAVIMDSDRISSDSEANATKRRIATELKGTRGVSWITECREIESYMPPDVFAVAVKTVHPTKNPVWEGDAWSDPFEGVEKPDKLSIARELTRSGNLTLERFDLRIKLAEIVAMIRAANGPIAHS